MEEIVVNENVVRALEIVEENRGAPGVDGMTVAELRRYLRRRWRELKAELLAGTYRPQPVRRVPIPKPDGGERLLGIPTALDRFVQTAVLLVLQPRWDPTFSAYSYGFRPGRSAIDAVMQAREYIAAGCAWVVDLDLEKFFDRVNHDVLMSRVARRVEDKRLLKLIRGFLTSGLMDGGVFWRTTEGTPQGGPLSPLLSNLLLDEWDRELESRNLRFTRYADDCNIYVRSERAASRLKETMTRWLGKRLRLKVNEQKSAAARPQDRKFLGFSFHVRDGETKRRIAPRSLERVKERIRELTERRRGGTFEGILERLHSYMCGWMGYYRHVDCKSVFEKLDQWLRRRLRCLLWHRWKTPKNRLQRLKRLGVDPTLARRAAWSPHGAWRLSRTDALHRALPNAFFVDRGTPSFVALARV